MFMRDLTRKIPISFVGQALPYGIELRQDQYLNMRRRYSCQKIV